MAADRARVVDTHAHLLPPEVWDLPHHPVGIRDVGGRAVLGDFDLAVGAARLSDVDVLLADMDEHGIDVRVVSPPPYAFPAAAPRAAPGSDGSGSPGTPEAQAGSTEVREARAEVDARWCARVTDALVAACAVAPDRLVPLGTVPTGHAATGAAAVRALPGRGAAGLAVPPLLGDVPVGEGAGAEVLLAAAALGLPVLLHPTQQPGPGLAAHYLRNLLGNPVETAAGVASVLLGGLSGTPGLRVLAVHGGGCVPAVVGRWDHGWRVRPETGTVLDHAPSWLLRAHELYADLLTHDDRTVATTRDAFGPRHVVLGSDYPFDMGVADPVLAAQRADVDLAATTDNALRWLGRPSAGLPAHDVTLEVPR